MAKVTINGEVFPFDLDRKPMSEVLIIEMGLDCTYTEWEAGMRAGSAKAFAGFVWAVLHRNGRTDVEIKDILSGDYPVDLAEVQIDRESDPDPTSPPPAASSSTAAATSASSPKSSASGRGKSST
ncbi:MAG TPA: hypothetical protein VF506_13555 [Streptosporangiaceae bacterium]